MTTLGEGTYATVVSAQFAIKNYKNTDNEPYNIAYDAIREVSILHHLIDSGVKCVPRLLQTTISFDNDELIAHTDSVMELINGNTYQSLINAGTSIEERCIIAERYLDRVISSLQELHQCGVVHNDLKLDNIIISDDDETAVIIDFGISTYSEAYDLFIPLYKTPEQLINFENTCESDYWLLAVCLVNFILQDPYIPVYDLDSRNIGCVLTGKYMNGEIYDLVDERDLHDEVIIPDSITTSLKTKLRPMLQFNKKDRQMGTVLPVTLESSQFKIDNSYSVYISLTIHNLANLLLTINSAMEDGIHPSRIGVVIDIFRRIIMELRHTYEPIQLALAITSLLCDSYKMMELIIERGQDPHTIHPIRVKILEITRWRILTRTNIQLSVGRTIENNLNKVLNDKNHHLLLSLSDVELKNYFSSN